MITNGKPFDVAQGRIDQKPVFAPGPGTGVSRSVPEDRVSASDAEKVIGAVCTELSSSMRSQYVEKKKIDPVVYARYFEIIRAYVVERLVRGEDALQPLYDRLSAVVPGLSKEEYKAAHKSRLEYLEKLVYDRVVDELVTEAVVVSAPGDGRLRPGAARGEDKSRSPRPGARYPLPRSRFHRTYLPISGWAKSFSRVL